MSDAAVPIVTLYTAPGCGLCGPVRDELRALTGRLGFALQVVDITADPAIESAYRHAVPVVTIDSIEVARAPIRPGTLRDLLAARRHDQVHGAGPS